MHQGWERNTGLNPSMDAFINSTWIMRPSGFATLTAPSNVIQHSLSPTDEADNMPITEQLMDAGRKLAEVPSAVLMNTMSDTSSV